MSFCSRRPGGLGLTLVILGTMLIGNSSNADVVRLGNGDVISGRLVSYQSGICVFDTQYGATVRLETKNITALTTDEAYNVAFVGDERATGRLTSGRDYTVLESPTFGAIRVDVSAIKSLVRSFPVDSAKDARSLNGTDGKIGEESSKQPPLTFLTGSTILLAPGRYELDFGLAHKQTRTASSLPAAGYFQMSAYSARQTMFDATIRGGLSEGLEGWVSVPLSYSYVEEVSTNRYVRDKSAWNLGDISFGLQYQLLSEGTALPAVSASVAVAAPTGRMKYNAPSDTWQDPLNNSGGHWSISPGLSFVRTTDPAILFGGANYQYAFRRTIDGYDVKPGSGTGFYFGVGYALNESLSVGTRFSYSHISKMEVDGQKIYGTDKDPMDISLSASYRFADKWVATPLVSFNLNDDAGAPSISLRFKRQLD